MAKPNGKAKTARRAPQELDRVFGHVEASRLMMEDSLYKVRATAAGLPQIAVRLARTAKALARSLQKLRG